MYIADIDNGGMITVILDKTLVSPSSTSEVGYFMRIQPEQDTQDLDQFEANTWLDITDIGNVVVLDNQDFKSKLEKEFTIFIVNKYNLKEVGNEA